MVVEDVSLIEPSAVTFTYNAKSGKWIGRDVFGNDVASGTHSVRLPGMQVRFFGEAFDNDDISVNPARGAAESMLFALTRGEQIAAASSRLSYADSANTSNADITVSDAAAAAATTLPELTNVLSNSISTIASTQFLKDGAIATVPRNFENLDLVSMTGQAEANFAVSEAHIPDLSTLTIGMLAEDGTRRRLVQPQQRAASGQWRKLDRCGPDCRYAECRRHNRLRQHRPGRQTCRSWHYGIRA